MSVSFVVTLAELADDWLIHLFFMHTYASALAAA